MLPRNLLRAILGTARRPTTPARFFEAVLSAERELWVVALCAMVLDVHLTVGGLMIGLQEMNPVARQALDEAGVLGLYGLKAVAFVVAVSLRPLVPDRHGGIVPLALALPSLCAVLINSALLAWVLL